MTTEPKAEEPTPEEPTPEEPTPEEPETFIPHAEGWCDGHACTDPHHDWARSQES